MSMENIERYIQESEAIKNYPQLERERNKLSRQVEKLNADLDKALEEVSYLRSLKAPLDGADMTLEEARLDFTRARDAEIQARVAERFEKVKSDYECKMPQLVYERLCDTLTQTSWPEEIARLVDVEAKKKADATLHDRSNWPQWFKEYYEEEVRKKVGAGLNQEFTTRVEAAAMTTAQRKLVQLANVDWPKWYRANVEPKLAELRSKLTDNALHLLRGPWIFACDQCGTSVNAELTAAEIEKLLRAGQIRVACGNPDCEDKGWLSTRRHTFRMSLLDLIETYIVSSEFPPQATAISSLHQSPPHD